VELYASPSTPMISTPPTAAEGDQAWWASYRDQVERSAQQAGRGGSPAQ
jgi:hypothetical protein